MSSKQEKKQSLTGSGGNIPDEKSDRVKNSDRSPPAKRCNPWMVGGICVFLVALVWVVFGQAVGFDFVNFDDAKYIGDNAAVAGGLTAHGLAAAFGSAGKDNWVPLTTLSHMMDCQFYGLKAAGHHFTNILLHAITVVLLFLTLRYMTGAMWRSAFVAAVFAIHPLRAESVAWVSERKDVLCGVFFILTLWCYAGYARQPRSIFRYLAALFFAACALMSKPMAVTLPLVLLLLDYWPLRRLLGGEGSTSILRLLIEKIPFAALSIASSLATMVIQKHVIEAAEAVSAVLRMENAIVSYAVYIRQLFLPMGLAAYYQFPTWGVPIGQVGAAVLLLAAVSWAVFYWRKRYPYLLIGWLWYLTMLLPVIGFVQVGSQAHADRYTYLPEIGLGLMVAWFAADFCSKKRHRLLMAGSAATVILAALVYCGRAQVSDWRNGGTLWARVVDCDQYDVRAYNNLGSYYYDNKRWEDAIAQYKMAVRINPKYTVVYNSLGQAYSQDGKTDAAIAQFQEAIKQYPDYANAHYNLGAALADKELTDQAIAEYQQALAIDPARAEPQNSSNPASPEEAAKRMKTDYSIFHDALGTALAWEGQTGEAIAQYRAALKLNPDFLDASSNLTSTLLKKDQPVDAKTHNNRGTVLRREGRVDDAIVQYREALKVDPNYAPAHYNLANALLQKGNVNDAIMEYQAALKLKPDNVMLQKNLARTVWILATSPDAAARNGTNAVAYAQTANELAGGSSPLILRVLAAAYAECGNFPEAIETGKKALTLATEQQNVPLQNALEQEISQYQAGSPVRADPRNMDGW